MTINLTNAINAYASAAKSTGMEARVGASAQGSDFADMVRDAAVGAKETALKGEAMSMQAAAGKADLSDVVIAVTNAEVALQTVVAVRDRVIQSYQEIMRMPL